MWRPPRNKRPFGAEKGRRYEVLERYGLSLPIAYLLNVDIVARILFFTLIPGINYPLPFFLLSFLLVPEEFHDGFTCYE